VAYGLYLNFERLSMNIIENEISNMTDDNIIYHGDDCCDELNERVFINNLYHGVIVASHIVNLYETALNTIVGRRLRCTEDEVLKTSHNVKLQLICTMYRTDLLAIKSDHNYGIVQSIIKLRNDITHYKSNEICEGIVVSSEVKMPRGTSKDPLAEMFTRSYMQKCYEGTLALLSKICDNCGLALYKDCQIIDCDGRDLLCEFIVEKAVYDTSERLGAPHE